MTPLAFFGLAWTPLSRQDLVWTLEDRTSGVLVGEFDGTVHPSLEAVGGAWLGKHVGLSGSIGVARLTNTVWIGEDDWQQRHWGVVRPSFDLRLSPWRPTAVPHPWFHVGLHGDIPSSRDLSNEYDEEEQAVADDLAYDDRARLGGVGGRTGFGAEYTVVPGLAIGAMASVVYHRALLQGDDTKTVTSWLGTTAQLLLSFQWGPKQPPPEEPPATP